MPKRIFVPPPLPDGRPAPEEAAARTRDLTAYRWGRIASLELNAQEWEAFDVVLLLAKADQKYGWTRDANGREVERGLAEMSAAWEAEVKMMALLGQQRFNDVREITNWYLVQLEQEARERFEAAGPTNG
jgi:hypothetical protein